MAKIQKKKNIQICSLTSIFFFFTRKKRKTFENKKNMSVFLGRSFRFFSSVSTREERIRTILETALKPTQLTVVDQSGGCEGGSVVVRITSSEFVGKSPVARHRQVNSLLKDELQSLHALSIEASTP